MCDSMLKEQKVHSTTLLPYHYYSGEIPNHYPKVSIHWHTEFEIINIIFGKCEIIYGSEILIAKSGDILIIPPNTLHGILPYNNFKMKFSSIVFSDSIFGNTVLERSYIHYIHPLVSGSLSIPAVITKKISEYGKLFETITLVFSHAKNNSEIDDLFVKSYILLFFGILFKEQIDYHKEAINSDFLLPTIDYISKNYKEDLKVQHLAENAKYSYSYFMKLFKYYTGLSVVDYINKFRIEQACMLILSTNLSISAIAYEVGFKNISNFNRFFKKITHLTPLKYRQKIKNEHFLKPNKKKTR